MICKNFSIYWRLVLLLLLISQANYFVFAQNRKVKLGEVFTLYSGESAETEDGKLKILSASVGRTISEGGENVFVKLRVNLNKSERLLRFGRGNQTTVGNFIIHIIAAESFGKTYCRLKISRRPKTRQRAANKLVDENWKKRIEKTRQFAAGFCYSNACRAIGALE